MNYIIGKMGMPIKFRPEKWGPVGGDQECPRLYLHLANSRPFDMFYIIGRSDWFRLTPEQQKEMNPAENIQCLCLQEDEYEDVWQKVKAKGLNKSNSKGIIYAGPAGGGMRDCIELKRSPRFGSPLSFQTRGGAPIAHVLNQTDVEYDLLVPDPRYFPIGSPDLVNAPQRCFCQYDMEGTREYVPLEQHGKLGQTRVKETWVGFRSPLETVELMHKPYPDFKAPKTESMLVILNEAKNGSLPRGEIINKWITPHFPYVKVHGIWKSEEYTSQDNICPPIPYQDYFETLKPYKFTFLVPMKEHNVSLKLWEMLSIGVFPFVHPMYDSQKHVQGLDYMRVSSPEEMKQKMETLDRNEGVRVQLMKDVWDLNMTPDLISGKYWEDQLLEN